ncbi:pilus motility taxis protein HmpF [Synechococcus elongatus]|uniref:Pilus motility taxis protein HmpF n=2 Tax=Synechococcus elongatus TaxID=32046 RepID=A0AAN1QPP7_SYNEL|nr:pilus motility taxis protein HmpF [Synechococcus elongatus]AZB73234.1 hypothetical protein DOP62_11360 [Synechococcus elongatus PCC 11801]QFZ92386.1 hypothetical protein EKO22_08515 [Synechococcus elongatus PCC 11802]
MLYLAEVGKRGGLFGGNKVEFRLIAFQRPDEGWQVLPEEEVVASDKNCDFATGALVLLDLNNSRQVQRVQEATQRLLGFLREFSRLQERYRAQEAEVEQWKESLSIQSQELSRRQQEFESRQDQLQQLQMELVQLEEQKQEAIAIQQQADALRAELDRRDRELKEAWQEIEIQRQTFSNQPFGAVSFSPDTQAAIARLEQQIASWNQDDTVLAELSHKVAAAQQDLQARIDSFAAPVQPEVGNLEELQQLLQEKRREFQTAHLKWMSQQSRLEQGKQHLSQEQALLSGLEKRRQSLAHACQLIRALVGEADRAALESMPIEELKERVATIQKDYERIYSFVNDQEEELRLETTDLEQLRANLEQANELERLALEGELIEAEQRCQLLDESLVAQRLIAQERLAVLQQYQHVLESRESGTPMPKEMDLSELRSLLESELPDVDSLIAQVQSRIEQLQADLDSLEGRIQTQADHVYRLKEALEASEEDWRKRELYVAEIKGYNQAIAGCRDWLQQIIQTYGDVQATVNTLLDQQRQQQAQRAELQQQVSELSHQLIAA